MRTFSNAKRARNESGAALAIFTIFMFSATVLAFFPGVYVKGYFDARSQAAALSLAVAEAAVAENAETVIYDGEPTIVVDCDTVQESAEATWGTLRGSLRTSAGLSLLSQNAEPFVDSFCVEPLDGAPPTRVRVEIVDTYRGNELTLWLGWSYEFTVASEATVASTKA